MYSRTRTSPRNSVERPPPVVGESRRPARFGCHRRPRYRAPRCRCMRYTWVMERKGKGLLLGGLVGVEVVSAALAWRDLARRSNDQVRGNKNAWRVLIAVNPGNSVAYWVFGRH